MKGKKNLGLEIVAILAIFIMSISILSKAFVIARERSVDAARLSDAVTLASNGADVFLSCENDEEIFEIFNEKGSAKLSDHVTAYFDDDLKADPDGTFCMKIITEENGDFIDADIVIYYRDMELYRINTGKGGKR